MRRALPAGGRSSPAPIGAAWLAAASLAAAADLKTLPMEVHGRESGFPGRPVTAMAQDRQGQLWVGTWGGGVLVHDGRSWRQLTSEDGLLSNYVTTLIPGGQGEVWIATGAGGAGVEGLCAAFRGSVLRPLEGGQWSASGGIQTRDGAVWIALRRGGVARFHQNRIEPIPGLEGVRVLEVVEGDGGSLWFLGRPLGGDVTSPGMIYRHEERGFRVLGPADGVPRVVLHDLYRDGAGTLWLGAQNGLYRLTGSRFERVPAGGASLERPVHAISEDSEGRLWLASAGAAVSLKDGAAREYRLPMELGPVPVLAALGSPAGGVFLATASHLMRLEGQVAETLVLAERGERLGPGGNDVLEQERTLDEVLERSPRLILDHEGGVWANLGVAVGRHAGDRARRYGRAEGLPGEDVRAVLADGRGRVWAGTAAGLARLDPELGWFAAIPGAEAPVETLFEDRGGAVYAGGPRGVVRVDGDAAQPWLAGAGLTGVRAFAADPKGRLWVGGDAGLAVATLEGLLTAVNPEALGGGPVLAVVAEETGLWVGLDRGLARVREGRVELQTAFRGRRVTGFLRRGGDVLLAVTPAGLLRVPDGTPVLRAGTASLVGAGLWSSSGALWLALDVGLLKQAGDLRALLAGRGLPALPARQLAEEHGGRLWIATGRGLYRHAPATGAPRLEVRRIRAGAEELPVEGGFALEGGCRDLLVELQGVSFAGGAGVRFQSRLRAPGAGWVDARASGLVAVGGLAPGRYTLEVRAVSTELLASEPVPIPFQVGKAEEIPEPPPLVLPPVARP